MKISHWLKIFSGFILVAYLLGCSNYKDEKPLYEISGTTMGTFYSVKIVKSPDQNERGYQKIEEKIEKTLEQMNLQMSVFWTDSEISTFNRFKNREWFSVSLDFASVMRNAINVSGKSDGAFDITVGALVNLWGFGPEHQKNEVPPKNLIDEAKKKTGFQDIDVRMKPPAIRKKNPDIVCDLSSIAKGFGVDKVCEVLNSKHIQDYLVEIGGEVRAKGRNPLGRLWRIGISSPDNSLGIQKIIFLSEDFGQSAATSGDYRNYFEKDGIRYSHTLDPGTGKPVTHKLASVTVLHEECMLADAFATAINVMGPEKGFKFAEREKLPVLMIIKCEDGFEEKMNPAFEKILFLNGA